MISGIELRNSFNRIMRGMYSIKDNSGSGASGRSGTTSINSKSYIDIYINICYDIISNYERENEVSERNIILFLNEFQISTTHFLDNPIQENTRVKAKNIINEYLNEIKSNYVSSKVHKAIDETNKVIQNFEKVDLIEEYRKSKKKFFSSKDDDYEVPTFSKKNKREKSPSGMSQAEKRELKKQRKQEEKLRKQQEKEEVVSTFDNTHSNKKEKKEYISKKAIGGQHNNSYSKSSEEIIQDVHKFDRNKIRFEEKESIFSKIFNKKVLIVLVFLIVGYFAFTNYQSFMPKQEVEVINETLVDDVLEKPQAPIVEEFMLSQLEADVISIINEKRVSYGHEEYEVNMVLSELGKSYLQVQLEEGSEVAKTKIGDLTKRMEKANASSNIRESYLNYEVSEEDVAKSLVDKIRFFDMYAKEMKGIGISIIEQDNKYHILLSIYK